jgi:hypothetical protein
MKVPQSITNTILRRRGPRVVLLTTQEERDRAARMLGTKQALLMLAHGCVVVGDSIPFAVHAAVTLRDNIIVQLGSEQAGSRSI